MTRFSVRLPIAIEGFGEGSTTDMSQSGIAFLVNGAIERDREIRFELKLDPGVIVECAGYVVRVEERDAKTFAAATIRELSFEYAM